MLAAHKNTFSKLAKTPLKWNMFSMFAPFPCYKTTISKEKPERIFCSGQTIWSPCKRRHPYPGLITYIQVSFYCQFAWESINKLRFLPPIKFVQVAPKPVHRQRLCRFCGFIGGKQGQNKLASSVDAIAISKIWKHYSLTHSPTHWPNDRGRC